MLKPDQKNATYFRTWMEEALQRYIFWSPVYRGEKDGRDYFSISFDDGTEGEYWIDWDNKTITPVE